MLDEWLMEASWDFSAIMYLCPLGWAFPGCSSASDLQMPFRVVFKGLQRNLSSANQSAAVFTGDALRDVPRAQARQWQEAVCRRQRQDERQQCWRRRWG